MKDRGYFGVCHPELVEGSVRPPSILRVREPILRQGPHEPALHRWAVNQDKSRLQRPGGTIENSPAIHGRVFFRNASRPSGTLERFRSRLPNPVDFKRPAGTRHIAFGYPAINCRAIFESPSGTLTDAVRLAGRVHPNPKSPSSSVSQDDGVFIRTTFAEPESRVAVALRATMESESVLSGPRRTECDGYPKALSRHR